MHVDDELVAVFVSQGPLAAEVAKGKLEAHGIPAMLRYQAIGRALGLTVDGLGMVEVLVRGEHAPEARDLLREEAEEGGVIREASDEQPDDAASD